MGLRGAHARPLGQKRPASHRRMSYGEPAAITASPSATPESPSAIWSKRYRARQAAGEACVTVPIGWRDIELLCSAGCLDGRQDFHSREEVAEALTQFLKLAREA
jgi:hypothetical protein